MQVMRLTFLFLAWCCWDRFVFLLCRRLFLQQSGNAPNGQNPVLLGLTAVLMLVAGVANLFASGVVLWPIRHR